MSIYWCYPFLSPLKSFIVTSMDSPDLLFLFMVHPASPPFSVAVKIDRVFFVENVEILGDGLPSVKTLAAVDSVVYDEKVIFNFQDYPDLSSNLLCFLLINFFVYLKCDGNLRRPLWKNHDRKAGFFHHRVIVKFDCAQ